MSSAARFVLEFEATGDQEVVSKIKAVGEAGKQTATDLESLRGIEDPFEPIATGADAAVAPIEGVGTAAEGAVTPITEMGTATDETVSILEGAGTTADEFGGAMEGVGTAADTAVTPLEGVGTAAGESLSIFEGAGTATGDFSANLDAVGGAADAATGGLEPANTLMGDFGESASTSADKTGDFGGSLQSMSGSIVSVAGTVGGLVSMLFTYQDAQARVQKAQLAAARAAEIYRKAQEAVNTLLATATSNEDAIAAARERVATALAKVNELMMAGVTSGAEFAAAQQELADAQKALGVEAAKGGVNVAKLTSALEKEELAMGKTVVATKNLDKQNREAMTTMLGMVSQAAGIGGSFVQMAGSFGKVTMALRGLSGGLTAVTGVGLAGLTAALGIGAAAVGVFLGAVLALSKAPYDQILGKLDQLGKSIGEILPQAKGPLTALGDAFRSSLNFLTKGTTDMIKALSGIDLESKIAGKSFSQLVEEFMKFGTVGNAEVNPALDAFIKKGREIGLTDKEIIELAKQHNAEFEKVANTTKLAGVAHGLFAGAVGEAAVSLEEMATQTEAQAAAAQKLVGPTVELNKTLAGTAETYAAITAEDVKYVAAKEAENRANIIASAGYNNANVAAIQYEQALTAMTQSMVQDTDQKNANAKATLALVNTELNAQNAIATVNEEYANSVDRLADLNTVLGNTEAKNKAVATAANEFKASLMEQNIELQGNLQALQDTENQQMATANAILETSVAYEESKQRIADLNAILSDSEAHNKAVATAVNETAAALMEESIELDAAIQSADSFSQAQIRLANAQKEGTLEIQNYVNGLKETAEKEAAMVAELERSGAAWSDIPPFVEKNIETLKLFGVAAKRGGEAAKEAADMAAEAWQDATSEMGSEIEGLADIFMKGGDKMNEATDKWFEDIEGKIGREMTGAEQEAVEGIAKMIEGTDQAINEWQLAQLLTGAVDAGADALASSFEAMASTVGGKLSEVFAKAAEIIRADPSMAAAVNDVMSNIGTTAPQLLLDQLNNILPPGMKAAAVTGANEMSNAVGAGLSGLPSQVGAIGEQAATAFGTGFTGNAVVDANTMVNSMGLNELPPKTGTAGGQAGSAFVSEWDANVQLAGNALASIVKTASTLKVQIPITADVSQAHQAIAGLVTKAQAMKVTVTADVSPAHQAIAALVTKQHPPIKITVNPAQALQGIKQVQTALNAIRQTKIPPVRVNPAQALAQIKNVNTQLNNIKQTKIPKVTVNNSQALSQINRVKSALNSLKNITRTITYRYRTVGSPPRGAQSGMHERLAEDTLISAHKGERVDINPTGGPAIEKPGPTHTIYSYNGGGRRGGGNEIVIPVTLMLDNKVLIRTVRRGLVEEVSGTM